MSSTTQPPATTLMQAKRLLASAANDIVRSNAPDLPSMAIVTHALGAILGHWTGQQVRVQITAAGQTAQVDATLPPPTTTTNESSQA